MINIIVVNHNIRTMNAGIKSARRLKQTSSPNFRRRSNTNTSMKSGSSSVYYSAYSSLNSLSSRKSTDLYRSHSEPSLHSASDRDHEVVSACHPNGKSSKNHLYPNEKSSVLRKYQDLKHQLDHVQKNKCDVSDCKENCLELLVKTMDIANGLVAIIEEIKKNPSVLEGLNSHSRHQSMPANLSTSSCSPSFSLTISSQRPIGRRHGRIQEDKMLNSGIFIWQLKVQKLKTQIYELNNKIESDEFSDNYGRRMQAILNPHGLDIDKNYVTLQISNVWNKKAKLRHLNTEVIVNVLDPLADSQVQPVRHFFDRSGACVVQQFLAQSVVNNFKSRYIIITVSIAPVEMQEEGRRVKQQLINSI